MALALSLSQQLTEGGEPQGFPIPLTEEGERKLE